MAESSEVRFQAAARTLAVIDGYCSASGEHRTGVINRILEEWAERKLHEATLICRVAGVDPSAPECCRQDRRKGD